MNSIKAVREVSQIPPLPRTVAAAGKGRYPREIPVVPACAAVSNTDGVFTFTNLEPGPYEFAATKDGFQKSSAIAEVDAHQVARVELPLQPAADLPRTAEKSNNPPLTEREKEMFERIARLEERLAAMEAKDSGATQAAANSVSRNRPLVPVTRAATRPWTAV
jgi:hypothetical protein